MSQENVKMATRAIESFAGRGIDAFDDLYVPDLEWFPAGPLAVQGEGYAGYPGREGLATYLRDRRAMWEEFRPVESQLRDLGNLVVMLGRLDVRVRSSGVTLDSPVGVIFDFQEGKISRMRAYLDHGDALRAAGLAE